MLRGIIIFGFVLTASYCRLCKDSDDLKKYFESDGVSQFRQKWNEHRSGLEHAIATVLQETIGRGSLNTFTFKPRSDWPIPDMELAKGYYHNHGRVGIILLNLRLVALPDSWLPEVSFALPSNVLRIETRLNKMVIDADYILLRNKSDLIAEFSEQNALKHSPFLFEQTPNVGKIALSVDQCMLTGYVISRMSYDTINLGHHKLSLTECEYTAEIYHPGSGVKPVIAPFSDKKATQGLQLHHLLLKKIEEELLPKLQGAIFSIVNTSAIFGQDYYEEFVSGVTGCFNSVDDGITSVIRKKNEEIAKINSGAVDIDDYTVTWDSSAIIPSRDEPYPQDQGVFMLSDMVLSGLDTAYLSHKGGPYKPNDGYLCIGEQIRFSTIQVRGKVTYTTLNSYLFAVEIKDLAMNIIIDSIRGNADLEIVGFRKMAFSEPEAVFKAAEGIITGYLLDAIPKIVYSRYQGITFRGPTNLQPFDNKIINKNAQLKNSIRSRSDGSSSSSSTTSSESD